MVLPDRQWNFLVTSAILLLALIIVYFPKSQLKEDNNNLQEKLVQDEFPFIKPPNIFNVDNLGDCGLPVRLPKYLKPEIKKIVDEGWKRHAFNQYVSDLIPVKRKLLDHRSESCKAKDATYSKFLPKTSIIIIFYNEAWSTLLRTVHSVLDRTPDCLIEEIILVDDFSDMGLLELFTV